MIKKRWLLLSLFVALIALIYFSGIGKHISLENIKAHRAELQQLVQEHYFFAVFAFLCACVVLTLTYLPVAWPLALVSGFLFGSVAGLVYVDLGVVVGALGMFFIARYFLGTFVQERFSKRLHSFNKSLEEHGANFLLTVHFLSIFPFSMIGTLAGLTHISWWSFAWTAAVGFLPSAAIFCVAGQQLGSVTSLSGIISVKMILLMICLALLAFIPILFKKFSKKSRKHS